MEISHNNSKCDEFMIDDKESMELKRKLIEVDKEEFTEVKKQKIMKDEKEELMEVQKELTEEDQFVKLFDAVLQQNRGELSDETISNGVNEPIGIFNRNVSGACEKEIYDKPGIICGFFIRYSPLYAGTTRKNLSVAFRYCKELRSCFTNLGSEEKNPLKIVDLGSGAGSALVGLYSAVYERDFPFKYLKVTATDYNKNWEKFFYGIVEKLRSKEDFGYASKLFKEKKIECSYILIDALTGNGNEIKENQEIEEADIILIKGFLSILKNDFERKSVSRAVAETMKPGSLLVVVDSPSYEYYFQVGLRMVYTTRKYLNTSSDSSHDSKPQTMSMDSKLEPKVSSCSSDDPSSTSESESQDGDSKYSTWEKYDRSGQRDVDKKDKYEFKTSEKAKYGRGFAPDSNQQIFVLVKDK